MARVGKLDDVLPEVCCRAGAKDVQYHCEVSLEQQRVEIDVDSALDTECMSVQQFHAWMLYHVEDLPFQLSVIPDVYTDFHKATQRDGVTRAPLSPRRGSCRVYCACWKWAWCRG